MGTRRAALVGFVALCAGCGHTATIHPADVPRLAAVDRGQTVTFTDLDGYPVEIDHYKSVTLVARDGGGYVLYGPIRAWHERGVLWLESGTDPPLPFDPIWFSRANVDYSSPNETVIVSIIGGALGSILLPGLILRGR